MKESVRFIFRVAVIFLIGSVILEVNKLCNNYYGSATKTDVHTVNMFLKYAKRFDKTYSDVEFQQRLKNFEASLDEIVTLNRLHNENVFGLTQFSDLSADEFRASMLSGLDLGSCHEQHRKCSWRRPRSKNLTFELPEKIDWREKGVVFPVLNQRRCAACWAFSIVGAMESRAAIHGKGKVRRSIQELIDCSKYNNGCSKGDLRTALEYLCVHKLPIVKEKKYPLTLKDEACRIPADHKVKGLQISEYTNACYVNDTFDINNTILRELAINGPVTAAVNASPWRNYLGGVIQAACMNTWDSLNHAIQIVGYDLTAPIPYYIIRNSWGTYYGENGYVKLAIGRNVCGIANNVAYFNIM